MDPATLEPRVQAVGRDLAAALPRGSRSPLRALDDRAMDFAAQDDELRAALFRFVDVVPACRSLDDLARHLTAFLDDVHEPPPSIDAALLMGGSAAGRKALGGAAAVGVRRMAHRFIVGETPADARRVLRELWDGGAAASVDLLGEATVTAAEADRYGARCAAALDELAGVYRGLDPRPLLEHDGAGATPRVNLSVKTSALTPLLRPDAPQLGVEDAAARLRPLLRSARDHGAHLHIDMESFDSREAVTDLVLGLLAEDEFADGPSAGVVLQAYLRESPEQLERLLAWTGERRRSGPLTVRLVKGAYWDHEVVEAVQHGWSPPVFEVKADSDRNFEALTRRLLEARAAGAPVRVAIASHNLRSVAHAVAANELAGRAGRSGGPGAARPGRRPAGRPRGDRPSRADLLPRRRPRRRDGLPRAPPAGEHEQRELPARSGGGRAARRPAGGAVTLGAFANEPLAELRRAPERERLLAALRALDAEPPLRAAVWIGEEQRLDDALVSTDPGDPGRVVATAPCASAAEVEAAVATARAAFADWAATPATDRAGALLRAAALLRERRPRLTALAVRECAKPWDQADGDVCEAIDFLEYYARAAVTLAERDAGGELLQPPGERNAMTHRPRGVCGVIAPWNFPLAIPLGMTAAALATGNCALLKPAEQAPGCALELVRALREGGVPAGAVALLPGAGETGAALARHPDVQTLAFTGSVPVGLDIIATAASAPARGARHLPRVVAELGGKNCVIVDADADLDDAVPGIVGSAFAYAGQKCSAASRVLVHEAIADALLERLAGAAEALVVGQADAFGTTVSPVIERSAQERVARYAQLAAATGRVVTGGEVAVPAGGWFCAPVVATDLPADSPLLHEEIFGPVLAVERVAGVDEACDRVDALAFALTGGLYCRNPHTVEHVVARSPVGNLYVNRPITGAMVGRQPFGGNRLSGTGSKAGGPDYLLHFTEPQVVTENTVRHGLVV